MKDLTIHASDGEIGSVAEFYFDDETWAIRYLIVKTGGWLSGRLLLISPVFLRQADWKTRRLQVALTKKQIEKSPEIDTHKPVSRQHEAEYMDYFGSSYYWGGSDLWGAGPYPAALAGVAIPIHARMSTAEPEWEDSHLRSTTEVTGYRIEATDGELGHVEDFIVDPDTWSIRYLEVSTRNWLPGKKVLVSPEWIDTVSWTDSKVCVDLPREIIKSAPEYMESSPLTREYENQLHEYYDRLPYWLREIGHAHVRRD
ncbi:MAG: PRC-barrel domain-containing protein [Bryobacteraceae bacterium]